MTAIYMLRNERSEYLKQADKLVKILEKRDFSDDEQKQLDDLKSKIQSLSGRIDQLEQMREAKQADDDPAFDESHETSCVTKPSRSIRAMPARYNSYGNVNVNTGKESEYSLGRALRCLSRGQAVNGLEGEISQEVMRRDDKVPSGPLSFFLPFNKREYGVYETRDTPSTTTTMAGGVTNQYSDDFLLLLRKQSIIDKLGIDVITDVRGNYIQPYETNGCSAQWVAEGSAVSASAMQVSSLVGVPRCLTTRYIATRQMLHSSNYDIDKIMFKDMANSTAEQLSVAIVQGNQSVNATSPEGFLYNVNINSTSLTTANTIEYGDCLDMVSTIQNANPPEGDPLKFLVSPFGAKTLRSTPRISSESAYPSFVMEGQKIADYDAVTSPCVPDNITVSGNGSSNSAILFGDFSQVRQVIWGSSVEVLVDIYSLAYMNEVAFWTMLTTDILTPRPSLLTWATFSS